MRKMCLGSWVNRVFVCLWWTLNNIKHSSHVYYLWWIITRTMKKNFVCTGNCNKVGSLAQSIKLLREKNAWKAGRTNFRMFKEYPHWPSSFNRSQVHDGDDVWKCQRISLQRFVSALLCNVYITLPFLDLKENQLQRKIELCQNLMEVYDKIDPGEANQRTNVAFELDCATIVNTKNRMKRNLIRKNEAVVWIQFLVK